MTKTCMLVTIEHAIKRPDHSNITGDGKRIVFQSEAQCTILSEACYFQRTFSLSSVHDSDKPQQMGTPVGLPVKSFSETTNRFRETLDVRKGHASSEKAAIVSTRQRNNCPMQDEADSAFLSYNFSSRFISDSELWTPRIICPDNDSHKLQVKNVLSLPNISSPRSHYNEECFISSPLSRYNSFSSNITLSYTPTPVTEVIPEKLYLGSEDDAFNNEQHLLALGITHVISVTNRINRIQGMEHKHFVMNDMGRTELKTVLDAVYPFMERAQQAEKKLFVHCKMGQNRSATLVISFLMKNKGLTLYEAHKKLREQRPLVQINENYAKMLLRLERELYGETSLPDDWMELDHCSVQNGHLSFKSEDLTIEEQQSFKASQKLRNVSKIDIDYPESQEYLLKNVMVTNFKQDNL